MRQVQLSMTSCIQGMLALIIQVLNVVSSGIRAAEHLYVDMGMGKATYRDAGSRHQCEHERQM